MPFALSVTERLKTEEIRRQGQVQELALLDTADQVTSIDEARLKREMKARFADIKALLGRHVSSAR
jgi:hypothetical protein